MASMERHAAPHTSRHAIHQRIRIKKMAQPDLVSNATQQISEHHGTPKYRGATHPLCFTNEVLDHEFPEGFKPVNIEAYDGTTDPGGLD